MMTAYCYITTITEWKWSDLNSYSVRNGFSFLLFSCWKTCINWTLKLNIRTAFVPRKKCFKIAQRSAESNWRDMYEYESKNNKKMALIVSTQEREKVTIVHAYQWLSYSESASTLILNVVTEQNHFMFGPVYSKWEILMQRCQVDNSQQLLWQRASSPNVHFSFGRKFGPFSANQKKMSRAVSRFNLLVLMLLLSTFDILAKNLSWQGRFEVRCANACAIWYQY